MTPDRLALAGSVVLVLGLALWSVPLAIVIAGAIMLATAVLLAAVDVLQARKREGGPGD